MNNRTPGRAILAVLSIVAVAGCSSDSVSYDITDRNHSITLLRDKPFFWSREYEQAAVIANMPECQRRYPLKNAGFDNYRVEIYDYDPDNHLWVVQGRYYLFDHITCKFREISPVTPPADQKLGEFVDDQKGVLVFRNLITNTVSKGTKGRGF